MSAGWVAGSVRARAMTRRRLGRGAARALAGSPGLAPAVSVLAHSPYGRDVRSGQTLIEVQRSVIDTVVWNARVLAGWVPREGATILRMLFGALEAANVADHLQRLSGGTPSEPFQLGGLATAWPRLSRTGTPQELRQALEASPWGDPGGDTPREISAVMAAVLADRVIAAVPSAASWAAGATALLVARTVVLQQEDLPPRASAATARVVGPLAVRSRTLADMRRSLPAYARWALADVDDPSELWRAEARWWTRVDNDGRSLIKAARPGPDVLVGAIAMMAADAWRVRAALELAARGGTSVEVFDEVA